MVDLTEPGLDGGCSGVEGGPNENAPANQKPIVTNVTRIRKIKSTNGDKGLLGNHFDINLLSIKEF